MKKIILVGAFALLAACGAVRERRVSVRRRWSTAVSIGIATPIVRPRGRRRHDDRSRDPTTRSRVNDFGDMPPKCIELLGKFLKKIEPTVSKIDWDKATLADFETFGEAVPSRVRLVRRPDTTRQAATSTTSRAPTKSSSNRWPLSPRPRHLARSASSSSSIASPSGNRVRRRAGRLRRHDRRDRAV